MHSSPPHSMVDSGRLEAEPAEEVAAWKIGLALTGQVQLSPLRPAVPHVRPSPFPSTSHPVHVSVVTTPLHATVSATHKQTPWHLVRERTIPTERPPLVDEIKCQLLWIQGCRMVSAADPPRH
jgi:hypothetical protein